MKKRYKILSLILAFLMVAAAFASCAEETPEAGGPTEDVPPTAPAPVTLAEGGESRYVIVHSSTDAAGRKAALTLCSRFEQYTGATLEVVDDRTAPVEGVPEILVGRTNRGTDYSLQRSLRVGEWVVAREGENIFLLGDNENLLNRAFAHLLDEVLDADFRVTAYGEIHRFSRNYGVESLLLNGIPLTDYAVWVEKRDAVGFDEMLEWFGERLEVISGYRMTVKEYEAGETVNEAPAIVLAQDRSLGEANYRIEADGGRISVAVGSKTTALALFADVIENKLPATAKGSVALTASTSGGCVSDNRLIPLSEGADIRVMTYNVLGNVEDAMPYVSATVGAYLPDFVCMQEYYGEANKQVTTYLAELGYGKICGKFTCASPTAVEREDLQYTNVGKYCNTPIFYRTDLWEEVESEAYLFYWQHRWPYTDTKSMAYGVFRSKSDGQLALVIGTHYALMADGYTEYKDLGYTDAKEGAEWRYQDTLEILKAVDALREKYPGILTVVGGDLNAAPTEKAIQTLENHAALSNAYEMAGYANRTSGGSYHNTHGKAPSASGQPIDHIFVSEDVADVTLHAILKEAYVLMGSDHCPVIADIARK